ncbi:MAG: MetS family NSS transporter small subunit [Candidatus Aminicenantes bacterium]|nr:MAG: MetS family NSS transporter small subunit [Candidatus Aminicenantes bacterium]
MTIDALIMMIFIFSVYLGGFIYTLYLSSKED